MNQQLIDYIKKTLKEGFSQEQIKETLLKEGWDKKDVDEALQSASQVQFSKSKTKLYWAIFIVIAILAVAGTTYAIWCGQKEINKQQEVLSQPIELPEPEEKTNAQKVLSDKEVSEILKEYARKTSYIEKPEIRYNELLLDTLEFKNGTIKERLEKTEKDLKKWGEALEDAPDMRGFIRARTKTCIAKSIIYNDLKHTCAIKEDSSVNLTDVDDILAVDNILPYFITGFVYYIEGDYSKADDYFRQVKLHRQAGIKQWGESYFLEVAGPPYEKIYNKTMKVSPGW